MDCAAFKRPEPFLETLKAAAESIPDAERLTSEAGRGIVYRRLPRINGAGRAASGRAVCRSCREAIGRGALRIALVFYADGRFEASGFVHVRCAPAYFETADVLERIRHFSRDLGDEDVRELRSELEAATSAPPSTPPR
jgi:hypothetical protein